MIRPEQIPDEVVEAAAMAMCAGNKWEEPCATPCVDCTGEARAAIAAALNKWLDIECNGKYTVVTLPLKDTQ